MGPLAATTKINVRRLFLMALIYCPAGNVRCWPIHIGRLKLQQRHWTKAAIKRDNTVTNYRNKAKTNKPTSVD